MQVSEILRGLADLIARAENDEPVNQTQEPEMAVDMGAPEAEPACGCEQGEVEIAEPEEEELGVMVSPLQQELELKKKAEGVPNMYDNSAEGDEYEAPEEDELAAIKRMAGIGESKPYDYGDEIRRQGQMSINPRMNAALIANGKAPKKFE